MDIIYTYYIMGKKCIPGVICIENMTLFVLILILGMVVYMFVSNQRLQYSNPNPPPQIHVPQIIRAPLQKDTFNDPYAPPLKMTGINMDYSQIGILTKDGLILPLMGRQYRSGRDKWQYYTISNSGNLNTKLPVSVKGKSCTSEYGCDQIMNGDQVYVEGYNNTFNSTVYETNMFSYIPQI
jgi:hypothetical protein